MLNRTQTEDNSLLQSLLLQIPRRQYVFWMQQSSAPFLCISILHPVQQQMYWTVPMELQLPIFWSKLAKSWRNETHHICKESSQWTWRLFSFHLSQICRLFSKICDTVCLSVLHSTCKISSLYIPFNNFSKGETKANPPSNLPLSFQTRTWCFCWIRKHSVR